MGVTASGVRAVCVTGQGDEQLAGRLKSGVCDKVINEVGLRKS